MAQLPTPIYAAGWYVYAESQNHGLERVTLRNTRLHKGNAYPAITELTKQLIADHWGMLHHGEVDGIWSVIIEREIEK